MTIIQTKITTQSKPIVLSDVGNTDSLEGFRNSIRDRVICYQTRQRGE